MSAVASRRGILAGLLAAPIAARADVGGNHAETLFREWRACQRRLSEPMTAEESSDDDDSLASRICERASAIETELCSGPSSMAALAAAALVELPFLIAESRAHGVASLDPAESSDRLALAILNHLRPVVGGEIGECVADVMDNPCRALSDGRMYVGAGRDPAPKTRKA